MTRACEVAVLETARGGMVLKGMGYESNDVSVLTNVSSDHLDLHGIHTLPELAEVKATVVRITPTGGCRRAQRDDPLVAAVARSVRARVCLFALMSAIRPRCAATWPTAAWPWSLRRLADGDATAPRGTRSCA